MVGHACQAGPAGSGPIKSMSYAVSYCRICGRELVSDINSSCPQCSLSFSNQQVEQSVSKTSIFDLAWAFVVWGVSGGFLLLFDILFRIGMYLTRGAMPDVKLTTFVVILSLALTMFMHIAGFI